MLVVKQTILPLPSEIVISGSSHLISGTAAIALVLLALFYFTIQHYLPSSSMIATQLSLLGPIMILGLETLVILIENCSFGSSSISLTIDTLPQTLCPSSEIANVSISVALT